jgi:hypothetical protein
VAQIPQRSDSLSIHPQTLKFDLLTPFPKQLTPASKMFNVFVALKMLHATIEGSGGKRKNYLGKT